MHTFDTQHLTHHKIEDTMTKTQQSEHEFISALLDGECTPEELDAYLNEIEASDGMLEAWEAFHISREVLHHEENMVLSADFNRRLRARLEAEPAHHENPALLTQNDSTLVSSSFNNVLPFKATKNQTTPPTQAHEVKPASHSSSTWWSMALAASCAALMVSGMWYNDHLPHQTASQNVVYSSRLTPVNAPKANQQVVVAQLSEKNAALQRSALLSEAELDRDYLMVHHAYSPSTSIQGMAPYARAVFTSENSASDTKY